MLTTDFQVVQLINKKCVCVCRERERREKSKCSKMLTVVKSKWWVYSISFNYSCYFSDILRTS